MSAHIALIGCGRWGINCLRDLKLLGCEVSVVAVSEDSRRRAEDSGASRVVSSIQELPQVDGAVVVTPTSTHAEMVVSLLDRQIPIFVEKPLTPDPVSAEGLLKLAPERIFVMDKWRYHPGIEKLRDIARSQELGRVLGLRSTRLQWNTNHQDVDAIWILAPHDLSVCLEVLGYLPDPRAASGDSVGGRAHSLIGQLGTNPYFVFEVSDRYHKYLREIRLVCENGIAVLDDGYAQAIQVVRTSAVKTNLTTTPEPELLPISSELPLLRELRAFVAYLSGGPAPRSTVAEAVRSVTVLSELRQLAGFESVPCSV
jgi:predicted dehydrogenase